MEGQDKSEKNISEANVESKEGERQLLSCNKANGRSPFLEFISNSPLVTEEMQLDYLASILVAIFLEQKRNGTKQQKESSDILPGFNQRAS